jgi:formylglycine-generating enzyme required for sulfatase activity
MALMKKEQDKKKQQEVFLKLDLFGDFSVIPGEASPPPDLEENQALAPVIAGGQPGGLSSGTVPSEEEGLLAAQEPDLRENGRMEPLISPLEIQLPRGIGEAPEQRVSNSLDMTFVLLPAGTFLMGSPESELGRDADEVPHAVTISQRFYMQATPVIQGQWQAVMGRALPATHLGSDLPVAGVKWQDCQEFIARLNTLGEGTYRLPTEAEWEYACRGGTLTALANGGLTFLYCELDPNLNELGWYCGNSGGRPQAVAQKHPNPWGLYDMHGNVSEWCEDWYGPYTEPPLTDPRGPNSGPGRVLRGGSWFSSAKNCRSATRSHWEPDSLSRLQTMGFRLVLTV